MLLVKVIRHGQVAIPANFREKLNIKEGDYLEAELDGKTIILRPKVFVDREDAVRALNEMMNEVHERTKNLNQDELDEMINEAISEVRQTKTKKARIIEREEITPHPLLEFAGILSDEEAEELKRIIETEFERI